MRGWRQRFAWFHLASKAQLTNKAAQLANKAKLACKAVCFRRKLGALALEPRKGSRRSSSHPHHRVQMFWSLIPTEYHCTWHCQTIRGSVLFVLPGGALLWTLSQTLENLLRIGAAPVYWRPIYGRSGRLVRTRVARTTRHHFHFLESKSSPFCILLSEWWGPLSRHQTSTSLSPLNPHYARHCQHRILHGYSWLRFAR